MLSFVSVQNNTTLKPSARSIAGNKSFVSVQNNTTLKLQRKPFISEIVLYLFKITQL